jgi:hypothetical protein
MPFDYNIIENGNNVVFTFTHTYRDQLIKSKLQKWKRLSYIYDNLSIRPSEAFLLTGHYQMDIWSPIIWGIGLGT